MIWINASVSVSGTASYNIVIYPYRWSYAEHISLPTECSCRLMPVVFAFESPIEVEVRCRSDESIAMIFELLGTTERDKYLAERVPYGAKVMVEVTGSVFYMVSVIAARVSLQQ